MIMPQPLLLLFLIVAAAAAASTGGDFTFNGFVGANFSLDGKATIEPNGLLRLTTPTRQTKGHAFYPTPFYFKYPGGGGGGGAIVSFSTTFAFAIVPEETDYSGNGIAFVVSHTRSYTTYLPNQYLGIFSPNTTGNSTNHILAVELDTIYNPEIQDIDNNHVGIDVNSIRSNDSHTAGYFDGNGSSSFKNLTLRSGQAMQVWVDFNGTDTRLNVTLAPLGTSKPALPLLSSFIDPNVVLDPMYVGFSSATGSFLTSHYILGWSFKLNGTAAALNNTLLPPVPRASTANGRSNSKLAIWLPFALSSVVLLAIAATVFVVKRRRKYAELLEDWEQEYGPHRFKYKDLFKATNGFKDKDLLGIGGFGRVYRGTLPASNLEVAVKRVSHDSKQGMKEFVAEIVSIGQMRHRNIVQLLGYCRRKGELLLVYDYMPNGSLDKLLYDPSNQAVLSWAQRFQIIKGVASGLLYLHEDWEQVVLHRDIKASNVLLDGEMNGRLGDFGLARLYDHGADPQTTHVVGTMGYLAPELARTGKATTKTDVFAYGAFLLEVACGRRPLEPEGRVEELVLVDWVVENWKKGSVLATSDLRLRGDFLVDEMEMVLKLGLLCCHPIPAARPSMRQVVRFLEGDATLPELSPAYMNFSILSYVQNEGFDDYIRSFPSTSVGSMSTFSGS